MIRALALIAASSSLAGCATLYPPLYSPPSVAKLEASGNAFRTDCENSADPLKQTIACAQILQSVYADGYSTSAKLNDFGQVPIIAAASAAAWILLKDKPNAATKVGKIGIGAGAYTALRNQLFPAALPEIFISGHGALGCVIDEGVYFSGEKAAFAVKNLDSQLSSLSALTLVATALRYKEPTDATNADLLKAARTLADQAITAANTQLDKSRGERGAYEFAASPFQASVRGIAHWVASKGRNRPNSSFEDLRSTLSSSPPSEGGSAEFFGTPGAATQFAALKSAADPGANATTADLVQLLAAASQALTQTTSALKANTPPFAARLTKVEKCAADLPSS